MLHLIFDKMNRNGGWVKRREVILTSVPIPAGEKHRAPFPNRVGEGHRTGGQADICDCLHHILKSFDKGLQQTQSEYCEA